MTSKNSEKKSSSNYEGLDSALKKYSSNVSDASKGAGVSPQPSSQSPTNERKELSNEEKKKVSKDKKELEKLKNWVTKKYPFTKSLSVISPQVVKFFIQEEEVPKETEKHIHLYMIIPEDNFKQAKDIQKDIMKKTESLEMEQKIWVQIKSHVDVWEMCFDGQYDLVNAVGMSYPLYDTGFLGILRVSEIHKSLVLQKFEKYVVSYVLVGSLISSGKATKDSEIDVSVIINDTDVKKMSRLELKERLRSIIYKYASEATSMAGVKNQLHIQTFLLTDFWDSVRDANPVIFTFIRDGAPLYDRQTFMPWKALLKMGKLTPSPESIDSFMKTAERTQQMVDRRLIESIHDLYYKILNPSQALIMLYGYPPPTHKETAAKMEEIFYVKEKMISKKYINILENALKMYKDLEDGKLKKVSGQEVDKMIKQSDEYITRLKELRKEIEKKSEGRIIEKVYNDIFEQLKAIFGKKSQEKIVEDFDKKLVKPGHISSKYLRILKNITEARKQHRQGKGDSRKIDRARKDGSILMSALSEYSQRKELIASEKGTMKIKYSEKGEKKTAELVILSDGVSFLFKDDKVKKLWNKIEDSSFNEAQKIIQENRVGEFKLKSNVFDLLKKEVGSFEIVL